MEIRRLEQQENQDTRQLYETVFSQDSKGFVDYYYAEKTKDNIIYAVIKDKGIRSMLHRNPYTVMVNGAEKRIDYIVAVATQKEYRSRGYMGELIRRALEDMYAEGRLFTFLMPAAEAIYLPYDFRTVYEQQIRYAGTEEKAMTEANDDDCRELADFANEQLSKKYQVYAKRDAAYYERLIKEYKSDGGRLLLRKEKGQIKDCRVWVPEKEPEDKAKIMIRIVDVRRMLMSVKVKSLIGVCFTVTDPLIEENNRCIVLTGTEFSGVMLMDAKPENSEGILPVSALSELIFGARTIEEVCREEHVVMSERMKEEMKKIIPLSGIYLNEIV